MDRKMKINLPENGKGAKYHASMCIYINLYILFLGQALVSIAVSIRSSVHMSQLIMDFHTIWYL
jgi:hypothetical protein